MSLKVGEINYTNIMPMFSKLPRQLLTDRGFQFIQAVPAELNQLMAEGKVDVGGISSFEYARNPQAYLVLPNLSVSSIGSVGSIFLFSKLPIQELDQADIALTSSSATSVHLLKILLKRYIYVNPEYYVETPSIQEMLNKYDACLLIGDDAIKASWEQPALYRYDLGALWYEWTGYPMTYALFAVRRTAAAANKPEIQLLYESFIQSKFDNMKDSFAELIKNINNTVGGSEDFWENYFRNLHFGLSDEHFKGLELYIRLLAEDGYIYGKAGIELWQPVNDDKISKVDVT
ncbi:menaquinone biosynthesis protein [Alkalicoccus halolimnae]|uniref:Chorismate dehydratase n=1 Tax=Alkalicoccus halolimnae TaxID=1667239 RepID=A0A5C7F3T6_9BACI|nr:menaquinone biosynthesis protein [Alkalicoccus halolimnae]TXF83008.1 menaquinone biosynthesis protein [Alkalicoccus halolimnae]